MKQLRSIVVGVDFTPCSATALGQAVRLARGGGGAARVRAVHTIETLVLEEVAEIMPPTAVAIVDSVKADAQQAWNEFAPGVDKSGVEFLVLVGNPLAEILAQSRGADLLVLGTHGTSPESQGTGTLATRCVRKAPTPVLLVRRSQTGPFRGVVAAVDFSETSRLALEAAAEVAVGDGAALHILHVFEAPWKRLHYRSPTPEAARDFQKQYSDILARRLEGFAQDVTSRPEVARLGPKFHLVESTSHGVGAVEFIQKHGCDLACLGTRGRTNLRDVLLGSTAERIVRQAPCSILAVKPPDQQPGQGE
ncbi:MAG: universal stress protein [Phycisphaerales bacterium]